MNVFEFLAIAILILSCTGVVIVDRLWRGGSDHQQRLEEHRVEQLAARIADLERHNEDLRQQLEWSRRLLEAQDRVLQQLGAPKANSGLPTVGTRT